jgi:hypothetical protein
MNPEPDLILTGSGSESGSDLFSEVGSGSGPNLSGSATLVGRPEERGGKEQEGRQHADTGGRKEHSTRAGRQAGIKQSGKAK